MLVRSPCSCSSWDCLFVSLQLVEYMVVCLVANLILNLSRRWRFLVGHKKEEACENVNLVSCLSLFLGVLSWSEAFSSTSTETPIIPLVPECFSFFLLFFSFLFLFFFHFSYFVFVFVLLRLFPFSLVRRKDWLKGLQWHQPSALSWECMDGTFLLSFCFSFLFFLFPFSFSSKLFFKRLFIFFSLLLSRSSWLKAASL